LPHPILDETHKRTFENDGVLLVHNLIPDQVLMKDLEYLLREHGRMPFEDAETNQKPWLYNGGVRALCRDGPVAKTVLSVMRSPLDDEVVMMEEAPIWEFGPGPHFAHSWHADSRQGHSTAEFPLVSLWLAVTDAPYAIEFILGSHKVREEVETFCARVVPGEKKNFTELDANCIDRLGGRLSQPMNMSRRLRANLKAGDAVIFHGETLHRGWRSRNRRVAISPRFQLHHRSPMPACTWKAVLVHPFSAETFDCIPWQVFAARDNSPWLPVSVGRLLGKMWSLAKV